MNKNFKELGKVIGKGALFGAGIMISVYMISAWQSSNYFAPSSGSGELTATSGEALTLDKWNELVSRTRGVNTDNSGVVNLGGNLKFQDGTTQTTAVVSAEGALNAIKSYTSSSTWSKPAGVSKVRVVVVGGGGGGGTGAPSSGGGAGAYCEKVIDVSSLSSVSVTVGGGGGAGATGGTSAFGSYCTATGGTGGSMTAYSNGGSSSGGDININGGRGKPAYSNSKGGAGADGPWGGGGIEAWRVYSNGTTYSALSGNAPGAGGGGGNNYNLTGASGAKGIVIVYEYK